MYVHWVTSFITSRSVCVYSCSQLRELWFNDLFMTLTDHFMSRQQLNVQCCTAVLTVISKLDVVQTADGIYHRVSCGHVTTL